MKVKNDHRSNFPIKAIGKKKPEKNQGFDGIRTRDLRDTGAMIILHFHLQPQFKYELFHIFFTSFHSSREDMNSTN